MLYTYGTAFIILNLCRIWAELDLNQRRRKPTDLQSVSINHSDIDPFVSHCLTIIAALSGFSKGLEKIFFDNV